MKFMDSSIWLAHLFEANEKISILFEEEDLIFSSILTIFEVKRKLEKEGFDSNKIFNSIDLIKKTSIVINLDEAIVNKAVEVSIEKKLSSMDSLIYASSLITGAKFVTADNDFRGLEYVEVISK
ncbi:PIN domain-containing protein [Candidatus Woesearchaeota archaeon]|nr:PIN domain-containing protein [Candidatus Woesearchaeota archaeon]